MKKTTPTLFLLSVLLILGTSMPSWAQRHRVTVGPGNGGGGGGRVTVSPRQAPQRVSAPRVRVQPSSPRVRQNSNVNRPRPSARPNYQPSGPSRSVVTPRPRNDYRPAQQNRPMHSGPSLTPGNEPFRYYNSGGTPRNGSAVPTRPTEPGRYTNPGQRVRVTPGRAPVNTNAYSRPRVPVSRPSNRPVYTQPTQVINNNYYYNNRSYRPSYTSWNSPYLYSNYNYRRGYRYYQPCAVPFLSLGFFATRPYNYYDYSRMSYAQPFVYGDDAYYRAAPVLDSSKNAVASTTPTAPVQSLEQELLSEISNYVDAGSKDGRFQLKDPAFGNQVWNLDLTEAPAVYSLDSNHYTVVAGFEGTLGENSVPSAVGLEFFVERENGLWKVKQSWIVSANGIPRAKRFQSPAFPQVKTWQEGAVCPFSGQPMVPVTESAAQQHG